MNDIAHNLAQVRDKIQPLPHAAAVLQKKLRCLQSVKRNLRALSKKRWLPASSRLAKTMSRKAWIKSATFRKRAQPVYSGTLLVRCSPIRAVWWPSILTGAIPFDRLKIAVRLSEQRPAQLPPLNVLIQINISDEQSKSGIPPEELDALAAEIAKLLICSYAV